MVKKLMPSLREKKRYLVYEVISKSNVQKEDIFKEIKTSLLSTMGVIGYAKTGPLFLTKKFKNNKGIIKIAHTVVDEVRLSLSLMKKITGVPVIIRIVGISGVLAKAE